MGRWCYGAASRLCISPQAWSFFAVSGPVRHARAWERLAARWTDAVLCVGEDERRLGQAAGIRARYEVMPNGVDLERFPAPIRLRGGARGHASGSVVSRSPYA